MHVSIIYYINRSRWLPPLPSPPQKPSAVVSGEEKGDPGLSGEEKKVLNPEKLLMVCRERRKAFADDF